MERTRIEKVIELARLGERKVCIWGAGFVGTNYGYQMLKELEISIDFYCDNNVQLYGKEIKDGIVCVDKKDIPLDAVCFVLTSGHLISDISKQLKEMGLTDVVNYMELCEYKSRDYFDFQKRNQIAVYTCVVGEYDEVAEPECIEEGCDYYIISDKKPKNGTIYKYLDINDYIEPEMQDNTRKNRYCKINPHKIFPQYRFSIYFDGNIILKEGISKYIEELPKTRITALARTSYNSVYAEALRCMLHGRDDKEKFLRQVEKYWLEGMPEEYGLVLPAVMVREHNNPICKSIMEQWWNEICSYSKRDMISFPYVLWKNGYSIDDVSTLAEALDVTDGNEWIVRRDHGKKRV